MIIVRAPVRISFGGGGTDLPAYYERWGGFVVSAAITQYCYVMARASRDGGIHIYSTDYYATASCPAGETPVIAEPLILPKAVVAWFVEQGLLHQGVDLVLAADVPPGTGLGSSSAMTVALVRALAEYSGLLLTTPALAELACMVEIQRLGMPIGKQDQYASACGGLNSFEFTSDGVELQLLELSPTVLEALSDRLMLFSTGQARHSATILREQRHASTTQPLVIEALHQLKGLAHEMRSVLRDGDLDRFGQLLDRGWQQKRSLSTAISSTAIDAWYSAARAAGAGGGKITGAGGGGFLLLYCPVDVKAVVRERMRACGLQELSFGFDMTGAQVLAGTKRDQRVANQYVSSYEREEEI